MAVFPWGTWPSAFCLQASEDAGQDWNLNPPHIWLTSREIDLTLIWCDRQKGHMEKEWRRSSWQNLLFPYVYMQQHIWVAWLTFKHQLSPLGADEAPDSDVPLERVWRPAEKSTFQLITSMVSFHQSLVQERVGMNIICQADTFAAWQFFCDSSPMQNLLCCEPVC